MGICGGVDFCERAQDGVGAEEKVNTSAGPLKFAGFPVAGFEGLLVRRERTPDGADVEKVDEKVVGEGFDLASEDAGLDAASVGI